MSYSFATPQHLTYFDDQIKSVAWRKTKFLNWMMGTANEVKRDPLSGNLVYNGGLIQNVGEGLDTITLTEFEKMAPGQITTGSFEAPSEILRMKQQTKYIMYVAARLEFPVNLVNAWQNNQYYAAKDLINQTITQKMNAMTNQVDQIVCYGDSFLTKLAGDKNAALSAHYGLFNHSAFQTFAAGLGADDNITAAGDLYGSYVTARDTMIGNDYDAGPYWILSDHLTKGEFEKGNHVYTVVPNTEYAAFMNQYGPNGTGEVAGWIFSPNAFSSATSTTSRMCVTQPFISVRGKDLEPAYKLFISYNFRTFWLYNGGLNGRAAYECIIVWAGEFAPMHTTSYALYKSGSLTKTT